VSYLVDSDWTADYLKGRVAAVDLLQQLRPGGLALSLVRFGEIYEGIYFGRDPEAAEAVFRAFLREVRVLPLNRGILRRFARIRGDLRRAGRSSVTRIVSLHPPPSSTIASSLPATSGTFAVSPV
jgi:predicted nucleic acid-binding protein